MTETEQWEEATRNMMATYKPGTGKTFGRKAGEPERESVPYPVAFARFQAALNKERGGG